MEKSVKDYIISRVFSHCNDLQVKDNYNKDGFLVGFSVLIPSYVFDNLYRNRTYFKKHNIMWFVCMMSFDGCDHPIPCLHFYYEEDEE